MTSQTGEQNKWSVFNEEALWGQNQSLDKLVVCQLVLHVLELPVYLVLFESDAFGSGYMYALIFSFILLIFPLAKVINLGAKGLHGIKSLTTEATSTYQ